ncbi:hypothetical protein [Desulfosediminicola flagellatus]|uniref:hypothetical protein n=1 Tax=Desulfosediminicola flagellatus TaxID=2569541 RepID=UPI0012946E48|nr:hypothetical protein [Desulfosediminicola flagellatus]
MRGTYEAYILVKVKDGRQFVCALNRKAKSANTAKLNWTEQLAYMKTQVIWN